MVSVTEATIRKNSFKAIYDLINTNKPSGWTVLSSFPESKPVFPCIVVNPSQTDVNVQGFNITHRLRTIEIVLEFYAKASSRKEAIDTALDSVEQTLLTNQTSLVSSKIILYGDTPIDQTEVGSIDINGDKLHFAFMHVLLRLL
jgi:hypothetical protein